MPTEDFFKRSTTFKGLSINDNIGLLTGGCVPWDLYYNVPVGSWYYQTDGKEYKKISTSDAQEGWALHKVTLEPLTPQYTYTSSTIENSTTDYVNIITLNAATVIGNIYLAKFSGVVVTPTSQGCTLGYFNGGTEITNTGHRINHADSEICINLALPITATATTTSLHFKIKSKGSGELCSVRNAAITLELAQ